MAYERFTKLDDLKHDRMAKASIGMGRAKFDRLAAAYDATQLDRLQRGEIKHIPSGGPKGHLDTFDKKLFFILYYLKTYPTFDVLGFPRPRLRHAHNHVEALLPVLLRSLSDLGVLPERSPGIPEEFLQLVEQYGDISIDGMECPCVRPQDDTLQALVLATLRRQILFLFCGFAGNTCLTHRIRNHLDPIIEYLFWLPEGPWNLKIA